MRLLPAGTLMKGKIIFQNIDLTKTDELILRHIRGGSISMIMQNPTLSLNPVINIRDQISEKIMKNKKNIKKSNIDAIKMLEKAGLPDPHFWSLKYPHELSGGMKQRVMVAMALSGSPKLLIADEPTKSLDFNARDQIISLIQEVTKEISLLLITHDIEASEKICDRIFVMYAGEIVESGPTYQVIHEPRHPYTQGLIRSMPKNGLNPIQGSSPSLINPPSGCRFHPRCLMREERCEKFAPSPVSIGNSMVSCWRWT